MPSSNPSLRAAETSEELEIFCAHSVNYSDKAAKILLDAIGQLNVGLDTLTMLAGGGARPMRSRKPFFENKLACEKGCTSHASIFSRRLGLLMT